MSIQDNGTAAKLYVRELTAREFTVASIQTLGVVELLRKETISGTLTSTQATLGSFTPPAVAGRYRIGGAITNTSGTNTGTTQLRLSYKDSQGTTHTSDILGLTGAAGTVVQTATAASVEFAVVEREITIDNSAVAIVFDSVVSGTVAATISTRISQVA